MDLFLDNFRGIRKVNPVVSPLEGLISAAICRNVELHFTQNGENVGIYTAMGNKIVSSLPGKTVIGQFESVQNNVNHWFVYAVDNENGYLYSYNVGEDSYTLLKDNLSPSRLCNGITIAQGFNDWFVFTNGVDDYVAVNMEQELESERVKQLNAVDAEGREIRGLCLEAYDGRLVTNTLNRVHWSAQQNIFDWSSSDPDVITSPHYEEFDRNITAIIFYNNMLIAFTREYSTYFTGNPGDASSLQRSGATGGGCASFKSVIRFDNKLFYYDYLAKNVFAYYLIDTGQTRPTDGLANNVIEFFDGIYSDRINEIEVVPYISGERSEIWFKLPYLDKNKILIFDYLKKEWIERSPQDDIRALSVIDGFLYSASGENILREYLTSRFGDEFIPAEYKMNVINVNSDSNLKVPKMPLIFTLDFDRDNDFFIEFVYDDKPEKPKIKRVVKLVKGYLIWSKNEEDENGGLWAESFDDENGGIWVSSDKNTVMFNLAGLLNFKQLQIRIYTQEEGQEFGIKRMELKRVKIKTKTIG